jgi:hypothetical protein
VPFPANIIGAIFYLGFPAFLLCKVTQHDYAWIEIEGATIRVKHLYWRNIVERRIDEIEELRTIALSAPTLLTTTTDNWFNRIKAVKIRFRDGNLPISIFRSGPPMINAAAVIEAIVFQMAQFGKIDTEIVNLDGKPIVRRIFWERT